MITPNAEIHALGPNRGKRGTVHAVPGLSEVSVPAQHTLRLRAINADASATTEISLSALWWELARGTSSLVDGFFSEARYYLVLSLKTNGAASAFEARRFEILQALLGGLRQKNIAIDLALAPSTVALNCRLALASLGVDCRPSRAHPLLMLAARTASEAALVLAKCSTFVGRDDRELRVVGMARPELCLATVLPSAELAVMSSLVEGLSYKEIARRRGTSTRTVANQISAVFRRLQVSGRDELVQRLFMQQTCASHARKALTETLVPQALAAQKPGADLDRARRSA